MGKVQITLDRDMVEAVLRVLSLGRYNFNAAEMQQYLQLLNDIAGRLEETAEGE